MFTGLIEDTGKLIRTVPGRNSKEFVISTKIPLNEVKLGDSICVNGACLTVTNINSASSEFTVQAVKETLDKTILGSLKPSSVLNLERSMILGGRLDGHLVTGHVDTTGRISKIKPVGDQKLFSVVFPSELTPYIVQKGSVALNGISLTVASVLGTTFDVAVIPFTIEHTNLKYLKVGDRVNIETDLIGKYIVKNLGK